MKPGLYFIDASTGQPTAPMARLPVRRWATATPTLTCTKFTITSTNLHRPYPLCPRSLSLPRPTSSLPPRLRSASSHLPFPRQMSLSTAGYRMWELPGRWGIYLAWGRKVSCTVCVVERVRSSLYLCETQSHTHTQLSWQVWRHSICLLLLAANVLEQQEARDDPQQRIDVLYEEG